MATTICSLDCVCRFHQKSHIPDLHGYDMLNKDGKDLLSIHGKKHSYQAFAALPHATALSELVLCQLIFLQL